MLDEAQLERTLDLWASMWEAGERVRFEDALERALIGAVFEEGARPQALAALAACLTIHTPRLLGAACSAVEHGWFSDDEQVAAEMVSRERERLLRHAERLRHQLGAVLFLLEKATRQPENVVVDKLLERIDLRDLWTALQLTGDERLHDEAARRIARRGRHQRSRLLTMLGLERTAFEEQLSVDVPLDEIDAMTVDVPLDDLCA